MKDITLETIAAAKAIIDANPPPLQTVRVSVSGLIIEFRPQDLERMLSPGWALPHHTPIGGCISSPIGGRWT
jgi:hypothetical protein